MMKNVYERGDFVWARLDGVGSEMRGTRPCVVVSSDIGNYFAPTVGVVPLTRQPKKPLITHAAIIWNGTVSTAACECIRSISSDRITSYAGRVSKSGMRGVEDGIKAYLGLAQVGGS